LRQKYKHNLKVYSLHPFRAHPRAPEAQQILDLLASDNIWQESRSFLALARYRTAVRAAEALGITHPTIGRHVRRLEDVLRVRLVTPGRGARVLTEQGEQVAEALSKIDLLFADLTTEVQGGRSGVEGMVRISISDGLGLVFLTPAIAGLERLYPKLQIYLKPLRSYVDLQDNQSDIMVGFARAASSEAVSEPLGILRYEPFASRRYIAEHGTPSSGVLSGHLFIDTDRYSTPGTLWDPWRETVSAGRIAHRCDASITYALMVKFGLGIGLLPDFNRYESSVQPLDLGFRIELPLFAIALKERLRLRHVRFAFDLVRQALGAGCPWLAADRGDAGPATAPPGYARIFNLPEARNGV
jgi:DNA-binding transcriptional LysR family regulator